MKNIALRCYFVLVPVLLLLSPSVFAKGRSTITYTWSVDIDGKNLQPVNNSTYTVTTTQSSSTFSQFRFEALLPSKVKLVGINPLACDAESDCTQMFKAIKPEQGDTIQQPDGTTYNRVEFVVFLNDVDFANMQVGESSGEIGLSDTHGSAFMIDPSDPSKNHYIHGQLLEGTITIKRDSSSTWSITCNARLILLKELEGRTVTRCRGQNCTNTVYFTEVAYGAAEPMAFDLIFTRLAH